MNTVSLSTFYILPPPHQLGHRRTRGSITLPEFHVTIKSLLARVIPMYNRRRRSFKDPSHIENADEDDQPPMVARYVERITREAGKNYLQDRGEETQSNRRPNYQVL